MLMEDESKDEDGHISWRAPLIFSVVLGAVAGVVVLVVSTGGAEQRPRFDLAGDAAGIAFLASVLLSSLLLWGAKPNRPDLGEGSGINRSMSPRGHRGQVQPGPAPEAESQQAPDVAQDAAPEPGPDPEPDVAQDAAPEPGPDPEPDVAQDADPSRGQTLSRMWRRTRH